MTNAGVHWVDVGDHFVPLYLTIIVSLSEILTVVRVYGARRLLSELHPRDQRFARWWRFCWVVLIPPLLVVMLVWQMVDEMIKPFGCGRGGAPARGPGRSGGVGNAA